MPVREEGSDWAVELAQWVSKVAVSAVASQAALAASEEAK